MTDAPSQTVLDDTPTRTLKFLSAVTATAPIYAALAAKGYTPADHDEGWQLLWKASGYTPEKPVIDTSVRDAVAELDAWDEPNFRIIRAALTRRHPEQAAFVFDGLEPATGPGAVLSVTKLLDRLDALEKGAERKATRKADHAALETLAQRGITSEERARLRDLIATASHVGDPVEDHESGAKAARNAALLNLRAWYDEWAETARAVIKRREHLIRLGLAKRLKRKAPEPAPEGGGKGPGGG